MSCRACTNNDATLFPMPCGCYRCEACVERCYEQRTCEHCPPWTQGQLGPLLVKAASYDLDALLLPALLDAARRERDGQYKPNPHWLDCHWNERTYETIKCFAREFACLPTNLLDFLKWCRAEEKEYLCFLAIEGYPYPLDVLLWCQNVTGPMHDGSAIM